MAKGYGMKGQGKDCKPGMKNKRKAAFLKMMNKPAFMKPKKNKKPKKS